MKQGTALEALARRKSRLDISEIEFSKDEVTCRTNSQGTLYSEANFKPTSDGSVAAITAGGELHSATKFGTTEEVDGRCDRIASVAIELKK